jgi:hypothetical protein
MTIFASPDYFENARTNKSAFLQTMFGVASAQAAGSGDVAALSTPKLKDSNILGVGYGVKVTAGTVTEELAIRVYVRAKVPRTGLPVIERVPDQINGVPTDIIVVGDLAAQFPRPVKCGLSCGHSKINTAGTIGCVVTSDGTNRFILSNWHVLTDGNGTKPGDDILEPGLLDGGTANPPIARLTAYQPVDFTGLPNRIDAAVAELIDPSDVGSEIDMIGPVTPSPMNAALYQSVRKRGRTTLHTIGTVMDLAADVRVRYGNKVAQFNDQIAVTGVNGAFSAGGDSGSLVVDAVTRRPVGLLFAGGGNITFCNHIQDVLGPFRVSIV